MEKELTIPQGIYKVGIDFPEGSYIFNSKGTQTEITGNFQDAEELFDFKAFKLNKSNDYKCRLNLTKGDKFSLQAQLSVSKASIISFDE